MPTIKIFKKSILPFDLLAAKVTKGAKPDVFRRHHDDHSEFPPAHSKRQIRPADPDSLISDSYRNSPGQIASDADDDDDDDDEDSPVKTPHRIAKQVAASRVTPAIHRLAKNHTLTAATVERKIQKHANPNTTTISTIPSNSRQIEGPTNRHPTSSATPTVTSVETGVAIPDTVSTPISQSQHGMPSSTLYTIIGAGVLTVVILGLCIWGCLTNKRREERRRSMWRMTANGSKPDEYGISSFVEGHSEKPRSADAKILNTINGKRLRGDSLSKKALARSRESELWGSKEEIHGYPFPIMLPYSEKEKQKSLYEDLDFGPVVMSTFEATNPPIPTLPPNAHHWKADHDYFTPVTNGSGPDGGYNTPRASFVPALHVDAPTVQESKFQRQDTRRKKDTIAGLTDAYGNVNGWDEVKHDFSDCPVECMPTGLLPLQSYLPNPTSSDLNDPTTYLPYATGAPDLSIPPPALAANSRNVSPEPSGISFLHPNSTTTRPMMSPSEASKELEHMLDRLGKDLSMNSSAGKPYDQYSSQPRAVNQYSAPFPDTTLSPFLPNLNTFTFNPMPPSEGPRISRNVSPTFIDPSIGRLNCYSPSFDASNYIGQNGQPAGVTPTHVLPSFGPRPSVNDIQGTKAGGSRPSSRLPSFVPLKSPDLTPTFTAQEPTQTSPTFTSIYPFFDSPRLALPTYPSPMPSGVVPESGSHQGPSQDVTVNDTRFIGNPQDAYHGIYDHAGTDYFTSRTLVRDESLNHNV